MAKTLEIGAEVLANIDRRYEERQAQYAKYRSRLEALKPERWREAFERIARVDGASAVFGELKKTESLVAVQRWLQSPKRGLCLRGGVGCGKTFAALYVLKSWTEPTVTADKEDGYPYFANVADVSWLRPDDLTSAVLHSYDAASPQLHHHVVLDDIGRETKPGFEEALCRLLEGHHVIVATSNLTREQMRSRYEPRTLDRLGHRLDAIDVKGPSLRCNGGF